MIYLFIGSDNLAKDTQLKRLKDHVLSKGTEQFNLDTLYARELTLKALQEKLLSLPVKNPKRLVIIKNIEDLKDEVKEFLEKYVRSPYPQVVMALDLNRLDRTDSFIKNISRFVKPVRFKETVHPDTFALGRSIDLKRADSALRILSGLLKDGERPERILGGLRYAWEKNAAHPLEKRKRLKCLLICDIDIKTGKLKPLFALEKLVVSLCGLR
jgi:DNA polymerase III delta subunit